MKTVVNLFLVLGVIWLLWSGLTLGFEDGKFFANPMLLTCGVISIVGVILFIRRMQFVDHEEILPLGAIFYLPWLLWEIFKANVDVAKRILSPSLPISPRLIKVKATQKRDLGRCIYANSITLTPGTVSVRMQDDVITVHALTEEAADGVKTGEMDARVTKMEGLS